MITPESASSDAATSPAMKSSSEQCVPLAAVQVDGTPPGVGDEVEYTVRGKISRVEGEKGYVTPETINGEPIGRDEPAMEPDEDDMAMKAAKEADDAY